MTTPVFRLVNDLIRQMSTGEFAVFFDKVRRERMIRAVVDAYHADSQIVFDTCRFWTSQLPLIVELFPASKVICCVRNLGWIINSLERAIAKDPTRASSLTGFRAGMTVYERAELYTNAQRGIIGRPYASLKEAWFGPHADRLILVEYDELTTQPQATMQRLYGQLSIDPWHHDLDAVAFEADAFDERMGAPGLHRVQGPVRRAIDRLIIPPDLFARFEDSAFWRSWRKHEAVA